MLVRNFITRETYQNNWKIFVSYFVLTITEMCFCYEVSVLKSEQNIPNTYMYLLNVINTCIMNKSANDRAYFGCVFKLCTIIACYHSCTFIKKKNICKIKLIYLGNIITITINSIAPNICAERFRSYTYYRFFNFSYQYIIKKSCRILFIFFFFGRGCYERLAHMCCAGE